jgi:magnesium-transporting ATPase (P-type)
MATEEKKGDGEEKKEINKSSGLNRNVLLSIIVSSGWLIFLILWLAFYASNYTVYRNIAIILVCILIMGAILGISWASWAMKYCWNGENDKGKKPRGWWQLKRIWVGFCVIVLLIAFGIAQPILWKLLTDADPPGAAINLSTLLTIVVALFALGLTGFSVLIDLLRNYYFRG